MSEQLLVQGKLLGIDEFLSSSAPGGNEQLNARSLWITLVSEVAPRALLADLQLSAQLLGSSGGAQFLVIIPDTFRSRADEFLTAAAQRIASATNNAVTLLWSATENLGDWTVVRKRLSDGLQARRDTPLLSGRDFEPFTAQAAEHTDFDPAFRTAASVSWSPDHSLLITTEPGKYTWPLTSDLSQEGIAIARHAAPAEREGEPATVEEMASRSNGRPLWGVLRGDVDDFGLRLRRLQSVEEHVHLSVLYKQFFASELEILCSMPEFWRRVTVLYSGGNAFAVYGSWDALISLARELQRMFGRFVEESLKDFPGPEAKTVTMACTLAEDAEGQEATPLSEAYALCGRELALAKASDKDCISILGRILEWKQLADAADLKDAVERVSEEFRRGSQFLSELDALYQKASSPYLTDQQRLLRRAYRFQRRFTAAATRGSKEREFGKLRTHLINEIVGRNVRPTKGKQFKLRPAGVVALEWARLAQEN